MNAERPSLPDGCERDALDDAISHALKQSVRQAEPSAPVKAHLLRTLRAGAPGHPQASSYPGWLRLGSVLIQAGTLVGICALVILNLWSVPRAAPPAVATRVRPTSNALLSRNSFIGPEQAACPAPGLMRVTHALADDTITLGCAKTPIRTSASPAAVHTRSASDPSVQDYEKPSRIALLKAQVTSEIESIVDPGSDIADLRAEKLEFTHHLPSTEPAEPPRGRPLRQWQELLLDS